MKKMFVLYALWLLICVVKDKCLRLSLAAREVTLIKINLSGKIIVSLKD